MEIKDEIKKIKGYNLIHCNIFYFLNSEEQKMLLNHLIQDIIHDNENIIPIALDLKKLQIDMLKLEANIHKLLLSENQEVTEKYYERIKK